MRPDSEKVPAPIIDQNQSSPDENEAMIRCVSPVFSDNQSHPSAGDTTAPDTSGGSGASMMFKPFETWVVIVTLCGFALAAGCDDGSELEGEMADVGVPVGDPDAGDGPPRPDAAPDRADADEPGTDEPDAGEPDPPAVELDAFGDCEGVAPMSLTRGVSRRWSGRSSTPISASSANTSTPSPWTRGSWRPWAWGSSPTESLRPSMPSRATRRAPPPLAS